MLQGGRRPQTACPPIQDMSALMLKRLNLVLPITLLYGLLLYVIIWVPGFEALPFLSGIFLMPMAIGSITCALNDPDGVKPLRNSVEKSWLGLLLLTLIVMIFFHEGVICVVMITPIYLPFSAFGCWITRYWVSRPSRRNTTLSIALLPLLALPLEGKIAWPDYFGEVTSVIEISASPEIIWAHTVEIPNLDPSALPWTFSHKVLQVPQPLDARMEGAGVGAVRYLTWTKDVHFREVITLWDENRRLGWDFGFDPDSIPPTIDRHIRVDSDYLHLARGEYVLEPLVDGRTRLRLTTRYRISTMMNPYLALWGRLFLDDFHSVVLDQVKERSEKAAG